MRGCVYISTQIYGICPSLVDDRWVLETTTACSNRNFSVLAYPACAKISYKIEWRTSHYKKDSLREESLGMPQPAVALSITNTMNPHFFSSSSLWKLLRGDFLNLLRPPELGGGVAAIESVRKNRLGRKKKEVRRKAEEERRGDKVGHEEEAGRGDSSRDQCAARRGGSADEDRPSSRVLRKCRAVIPPPLPLPPSHPILPPSPHGKFRMENSERRQTFLFLSFFLPSQSVENTFAPGRLGARSAGKVRVVAWRRRGVRGGSS